VPTVEHVEYHLKRKPIANFSTTFFITGLLCLGLLEAFIIRGLWLSANSSVHHLRGFELPFLVWIPAASALVLRRYIGKALQRGQISADFAANLDSGLCILLLMTYLLMTRLAEIYFR
jgi:hypothetical protein